MSCRVTISPQKLSTVYSPLFIPEKQTAQKVKYERQHAKKAWVVVLIFFRGRMPDLISMSENKLPSFFFVSVKKIHTA